MYVGPGFYRHYKGGDYYVLGLATHSETEEEMVIYQKSQEDSVLYVRPRRSFDEILIFSDTEQGLTTVHRFVKIKEEE